MGFMQVGDASDDDTFAHLSALGHRQLQKAISWTTHRHKLDFLQF
jgi:hypothetical protein